MKSSLIITFSILLSILHLVSAKHVVHHRSRHHAKKVHHHAAKTKPAHKPTPTTKKGKGTGTRLDATGGSKKGLGFIDVSLTTNFALHWAYNWGSKNWGNIQGVEYVPMLWGGGSDRTSSWASDVQAAGNAGSTHLLGFNEPDLVSQSNLSPGEAVRLWNQYMEPYAGQFKLVSPAVTNSHAPRGLAWLQEFVNQCNGCSIDAVASHWYSTGSATDFQDYYTAMHAQFGTPIWITEFAPSSRSIADQEAFYAEIVPWLDAQPWIQRYAAFGDFTNVPNGVGGSFVRGDGSLTSLGQAYANA
jgi:hypothetical protein